MKATLNVRRVKVAELNPAPYNPRTITDEAMAGLTISIERFGVVEPIVVNDTTGHVVGGHQRLKVLAASGAEETDVVCVELPVEEEQALNVALNNPHTAGDWTDALGPLLDDIHAQTPELFDGLEFGALLEELDRGGGIPEDNEDIDEDAFAETDHECPKCGFKW